MSTKPLLAYFQDEFITLLEKYSDQGLTNAEAYGGIILILLEFWWFKRNDELKEMITKIIKEMDI